MTATVLAFKKTNQNTQMCTLFCLVDIKKRSFLNLSCVFVNQVILSIKLVTMVGHCYLHNLDFENTVR